uniref:Putative product n=1 Tax=Xenopsylla cheopis TaxID=163159 RepID=A0A6M2E186_XENCH
MHLILRLLMKLLYILEPLLSKWIVKMNVKLQQNRKQQQQPKVILLQPLKVKVVLRTWVQAIVLIVWIALIVFHLLPKCQWVDHLNSNNSKLLNNHLQLMQKLLLLQVEVLAAAVDLYIQTIVQIRL